MIPTLRVRASDELHADMISVQGYGTMPFRRYLDLTDLAIEAHLAKVDAAEARRWLLTVGIITADDVKAYWERRPLFDSPADMPHTARCRRCGRPITNWFSILVGLGPGCRKPRKETHNAR